LRRPAKPSLRAGIVDHTGKSLGGAQLVAACLAATLSRLYTVDLISDRREFTVSELASTFDLDLERVTERIVPGLCDGGFEIPGPNNALKQITRSRMLADSYDIFVYSGHGVPPFCRGKQGLIYSHFPRQPAPRVGLEGSSEWANRTRLGRLIRGEVYDLLWRIRMRPYKAVLANSSFTARWVEKYWDVPAEVVYPPVDVNLPDVRKQNLIVSVGRFDPSFRRNKQQLAQATSFRQFINKVGRSWKMYFVGSCRTPREQTYLEAVKDAVEGLPVTFLTNADRPTLTRALAEAKLFWHTQGLFSNDSEHPWEAEHFGIATVEAMRAGCVPVVIASGGQKEIIEDGVSGFLCKDLPELVENSEGLAHNDDVLRRVSERARQRSMAFTRDIFEERVMQVISQHLSI
jgi:L-malate glycosyltransferase